jgi:hypothetical protein
VHVPGIVIIVVAAAALLEPRLQSPVTPQAQEAAVLNVVPPAGWTAQTEALGQLELTHAGPPAYWLTVQPSTARAPVRSCMAILGLLTDPGTGAKLADRPGFIPSDFFGSVLRLDKSYFTCLAAGSGYVGVWIHLKNDDPRPSVVTPALLAIAKAALELYPSVAAPVTLKLPVLGIEIPLRRGAWGVRSLAETWGTADLIGRRGAAGSNEVYVTAFAAQPPEDCASLMSRPAIRGALSSPAKDGTYGGSRWWPDAAEQLMPPMNSLMAFACRPLASGALMVRIDYEKHSVTGEDRQLLKGMLDDIGDALDRKTWHPNASSR